MPVSNASSGVAAGTVAYFASSSAPAGWISANGATLSRSTYAGLFQAIGTTYGVGDGVSTFAIPDLRGEFVRGWDQSRGIDSGRVFGSAQADIMKGHTHGAGTLETSAAGFGAVNAPDVSQGTGGTSVVADNAGTHTHAITGNTGGIDGGSGSETRPRNVALLACIKF